MSEQLEITCPNCNGRKMQHVCEPENGIDCGEICQCSTCRMTGRKKIGHLERCHCDCCEPEMVYTHEELLAWHKEQVDMAMKSLPHNYNLLREKLGLPVEKREPTNIGVGPIE